MVLWWKSLVLVVMGGCRSSSGVGCMKGFVFSLELNAGAEGERA